jgi:hypothetical protein
MSARDAVVANRQYIISRRPRPVVEWRQRTAHRSRIRQSIARLHEVRETGIDWGRGRRVAALAASSASSLPKVPMCAGIQRTVIQSTGRLFDAERTNTSNRMARC